MYFIVNPNGPNLKAKTAKDVYDFLYLHNAEPGSVKEIENLSSNSFDFVTYCGFQISREDGRSLRELEFVN